MCDLKQTLYGDNKVIRKGTGISTQNQLCIKQLICFICLPFVTLCLGDK